MALKKLSSRIDPKRCPDCNRLGSYRYGGRCSPCYNKMIAETKDMPLTRSFYKASFGEGFTNKEWHPKEYGIVKDGFGISK